MHLKGIEKLREKLPDYPGNRIGLFPLSGLLVAMVGYVFLVILDVLPRIFSDILFLGIIEPLMPILGSLLLATLGFWLIGEVWRKRDSMKAEYGDRAYQMMIKKGVIGVFMIPPLVFHAATSFRSLPFGPPVNEITWLLSQPVLPLIGVPTVIDLAIRVTLSAIFVILGLLIVKSAFLTFGIDYMTVVYLYYPEESEIQNHEIYSVIRHPTYLGGVLLGLAAFFFRLTVYSFILFVIVYLVFILQVRREDMELVERFGEGYREYMRNTPALFVHPRNWKTLFRFLE
jgi:protein-S-isoprenylcysteine O-methyltransferase Ste14